MNSFNINSSQPIPPLIQALNVLDEMVVFAGDFSHQYTDRYALIDAPTQFGFGVVRALAGIPKGILEFASHIFQEYPDRVLNLTSQINRQLSPIAGFIATPFVSIAVLGSFLVYEPLIGLIQEAKAIDQEILAGHSIPWMRIGGLMTGACLFAYGTRSMSLGGFRVGKKLFNKAAGRIVEFIQDSSPPPLVSVASSGKTRILGGVIPTEAAKVPKGRIFRPWLAPSLLFMTGGAPLGSIEAGILERQLEVALKENNSEKISELIKQFEDRIGKAPVRQLKRWAEKYFDAKFIGQILKSDNPSLEACFAAYQATRLGIACFRALIERQEFDTAIDIHLAIQDGKKIMVRLDSSNGGFVFVATADMALTVPEVAAFFNRMRTSLPTVEVKLPFDAKRIVSQAELFDFMKNLGDETLFIHFLEGQILAKNSGILREVFSVMERDLAFKELVIRAFNLEGFRRLQQGMYQMEIYNHPLSALVFLNWNIAFLTDGVFKFLSELVGDESIIGHKLPLEKKIEFVRVLREIGDERALAILEKAKIELEQ